jgi:hypothetical protein
MKNPICNFCGWFAVSSPEHNICANCRACLELLYNPESPAPDPFFREEIYWSPVMSVYLFGNPEGENVILTKVLNKAGLWVETEIDTEDYKTAYGFNLARLSQLFNQLQSKVRNNENMLARAAESQERYREREGYFRITNNGYIIG